MHLEVRDETGQIGGVEAMIFGVLIFVLGALVISNAWGVIDGKLAAGDAAREAARAFVQASSGSDPIAAAQQAATFVVSTEGRDPRRMIISVDGTLTRCTRVTVTVRYRVPLITIPILGGLGGGFVSSARASELVDPYRNGINGEALCAI